MLFLQSLAFIILFTSASASAEDVHVAVAANFVKPMESLVKDFQTKTGHHLTVTSGSTGKLATQIQNGAPFDLFFSADRDAPQKLAKAQLARPQSEFVYARGVLVLWSAKKGFVDKAGQVLTHGQYQHLAIANPKLAPYGKAAQEYLTQLKMWHQVTKKLVIGENIAQTQQFVASGNAELGFLAKSQIDPQVGSGWEIPLDQYSPIEQTAVLLKHGEGNSGAKEFLIFMQGDQAKTMIQSFGYLTP